MAEKKKSELEKRQKVNEESIAQAVKFPNESIMEALLWKKRKEDKLRKYGAYCDLCTECFRVQVDVMCGDETIKCRCGEINAKWQPSETYVMTEELRHRIFDTTAALKKRLGEAWH